MIPFHPVYGVPDWEFPETAIEWPRFLRDLEMTKSGITTSRPPRHQSNLDVCSIFYGIGVNITDVATTSGLSPSS